MSRLVTMLALVVPLGGCEQERAPGSLRGSAPADALWVLSYNLNYERSSDETITAITEADADVVFLQEVDARWKAKLRKAFAGHYSHTRFRPARDEGGMAILSRHPVRDRGLSRAPAGDFPAWCAKVATPLGELTALHVHLQPPLDDEGRLLVGYFTTGSKRYRELTHHLRCFEAPPDLVVGDFNEGQGRAVAHLRSLGLRQAQMAFPPVERTWSWDTSAAELSGRPDHIFVGSRLDVAAVQVIRRGGSDHRPLRAAVVRSASAPGGAGR